MVHVCSSCRTVGHQGAAVVGDEVVDAEANAEDVEDAEQDVVAEVSVADGTAVAVEGSIPLLLGRLEMGGVVGGCRVLQGVAEGAQGGRDEEVVLDMLEGEVVAGICDPAVDHQMDCQL